MLASNGSRRARYVLSYISHVVVESQNYCNHGISKNRDINFVRTKNDFLLCSKGFEPQNPLSAHATELQLLTAVCRGSPSVMISKLRPCTSRTVSHVDFRSDLRWQVLCFKTAVLCRNAQITLVASCISTGALHSFASQSLQVIHSHGPHRLCIQLPTVHTYDNRTAVCDSLLWVRIMQQSVLHHNSQALTEHVQTEVKNIFSQDEELHLTPPSHFCDLGRACV